MDSASSMIQDKNSISNDHKQRSPDDTIQVEFAVDIKEQSHLNDIEETLKSKGIEVVSSNLERKTIQIDLGNEQDHNELRNVQNLQEFIERQLGFVTVVKGLGRLSSAVAELRPSAESAREGELIIGLVRLSQLVDNKCYVDASISGFKCENKNTKITGCYKLAIHEYGDLQGDSYNSIGEPLVGIMEEVIGDEKRVVKMSIERTIADCNVASMIGKSIGITEYCLTPDQSKRVLSAGVIARASKIGLNNKKFCSCSGNTIWDERLERRKVD